MISRNDQINVFFSIIINNWGKIVCLLSFDFILIVKDGTRQTIKYRLFESYLISLLFPVVDIFLNCIVDTCVSL